MANDERYSSTPTSATIPTPTISDVGSDDEYLNQETMTESVGASSVWCTGVILD